jgi:glutathione S-transferase
MGGGQLTEVKLYSIPGSHPAAAARAMLEHKGIPYRRVDLPPVVSRGLMRLLGFAGNRVPAMKVEGRKVQGSRNISRELDVIKPDPPLFPADPGQRAAVEEAERWGDEEFQQMPRTISWWALKRRKSDQGSYLADAGPIARMGMPTKLAVATSGPILRTAIRMNDSTDDTVRATLASIGPALDHVDGLIAQGVIGGEQPNAADFQIGASVALLRTFEDVRAAIEERPAAGLARRLYPWYPGHVSPVFPPEWVEPLRQKAATQP